MPVQPEPGDRSDAGSILLPVILVLLLIASAAAAMTLHAKASLREAATRRDRTTLGFVADALVRSAAVALAQATATKSAPPFPIDGTPQSCWLSDRRRAVLAIQDQGGLVDLNKAPSELLVLLLSRASLGGWDADALADAIVSVRETDGKSSKPAPGSRRGVAPSSGHAGFISADQLDGLPHMTAALFNTLRPMFTVANGAAGIDPVVAGPAVRAVLTRRDMAAAEFQTFAIPSSHAAFDIRATVTMPTGMRFIRSAAYRLDPAAGAGGRFVEWNALIDTGPLQAGAESAFCAGFATALSAPATANLP